MTRLYEQLAAAADRPYALALISGTKGSSPQRAGAKALFFADGKITGTLGGGCLEAEVHARALAALKSGQPAEFELVLDHDFGWDDGLICGGSVNGLILPHAALANDLWRELAGVTAPVRWGVRRDFSIAKVPGSEAGESVQTDGVGKAGGRQYVGPPAGLETRETADWEVCGTKSPPTTSGGTAGEWLYQETVAPPVELWIAGSGHVAQAVGRRSRGNWISPSPFSTTGRNWPTGNFSRRRSSCGSAPGTNC